MSVAPLREVVVVGASLAGLRAAEALRTQGFEGRLTMIGAEPHRPYDRPPLSKSVLTGADARERLALRTRGDLAADWMLGEPATSLDLDARVVHTSRGAVPFDGLVIATGSVPRRLQGLSPETPGIHELRTIDDALRLAAALVRGPRLLVVGAGFIGMEIASTARSLGLDVTVVSLEAPLAPAGALLSNFATGLLSANGVRLETGRGIASVSGGTRDDEPFRVELTDGMVVEGDAVVSAVGVRPATDWLERSGLTLDDGLVCDAACAAVGADRVVAAGDVVRWPNPLAGDGRVRVEHWLNAVEQGRAAASTLLHGSSDATAHQALPSFWSDQFGHRLQALGMTRLADRFEVVDGAVADARFAAVGLRRDEPVAAVACDMPAALAALRARLLGDGKPAVARAVG